MADFYPMERSGRCYMFSKLPVFPISEKFGEHSAADRVCNDVDADLVEVEDAQEAEDIVGMASKQTR